MKGMAIVRVPIYKEYGFGMAHRTTMKRYSFRLVPSWKTKFKATGM
jgi:hypothetical protein